MSPVRELGRMSLGMAATNVPTNGPKGLFVFFDYFVSLAAIIVNIVVLRTVLRARINLKGYKYGLASLGVSNLFVCVVNSCIFVINGVRHQYDSECWGQIFRSLQISGLIANLLNLLYMSCDHLVGIVYPFLYAKLSRRSTVRLCITSLWAVAIFFGSAELPLTTYLYTTTFRNFSEPVPNITRSNCTLMGKLPGVWPREGHGALDPKNFHEIQREIEIAEKLLSDGDTSLPPTTMGKPVAVWQRSGGNAELEFLQAMQRIENTTQLGNIMNSECGVSDFVSVEQTQAAGEPPPVEQSAFLRWCSFYKNAPYLEYAIMFLTIGCFSFVVFCYAKIFKEIFFHGNSPHRKNVRKLVMTTLLLLGTFFICYLPFMMFELTMVLAMHFNFGATFVLKRALPSFLHAHNVFNSFLIMSPLLQPLIYACRLSIVRRGLLADLKAMARKCCGWCAQRSQSLSDTGSRGTSFSIPNTNMGNGYESGARNLCGVRTPSLTPQDTEAAAQMCMEQLPVPVPYSLSGEEPNESNNINNIGNNILHLEQSDINYNDSQNKNSTSNNILHLEQDDTKSNDSNDSNYKGNHILYLEQSDIV